MNFYLNHGLGGIQRGRLATEEEPFALHHFDTGIQALAESNRAIAPLSLAGFPIWQIRPIVLEICDRVPWRPSIFEGITALEKFDRHAGWRQHDFFVIRHNVFGGTGGILHFKKALAEGGIAVDVEDLSVRIL